MAAVVNAITSTFSGLLNPRRNGVAFPDDVHEVVIKAYVDLCVTSVGLQSCGNHQELVQQKVLLKIALVSKLFCHLACKEWNAYWLLPHSRPPASYWILARPNFYFQSCPVDLSHWSRLRLACLDFSDAFRYQNNAWNIPLLVSGLPQSLERIEFRRPHATEIDVIELLGRLCPGVVELRIVHCTMFNHPGCMWWHGHQAQEDHLYIKGSDTHEVVNHAESLAQHLQGLPNLQQLHLEVYFVPFDAITTHRDDHTSYHRVKDKKWYVDGIQYHNAVHFEATWDDEHHDWPLPNLHLPRLAPIGIWQTRCPLCARDYSGQAERAERLTVSVLAARHWVLRKVSFPSYFSDDSITPNIWEVERWLEHPSGPRLQVNPGALPQDGYVDGTKLHVYTERVGGRSSRQGTSFRWSGAGWVPEV